MDIDEIAKYKDKCIQEEPPFCQAACPVHVDVRFLMQNIREGDYDKAYRMYARKVLFPGIISRVCDEPCKGSCIRKKLDDPLSIRLLEKAVVDYSESKDAGGYAAVKKRHRVCVIGGGLSGMSCALDLARRGYPVTLYEKSSKLGGRLRDIDPSILPKQILDEEIRRLDDEEVEVIPNTEIKSLDNLDFAAIFIAAGSESAEFAGLRPKDEARPEYKVTFETLQKGVFIIPAASDKKYSSIVAVLQGLQASRSIERYLKNTSLYHNRENELSTDTCLYTNTSGEKKKQAIVPSDLISGYTKEEAHEEASRCLLCECMECDRQCLYLNNYGSYPKVYIDEFVKWYSMPMVSYGAGGGRLAHGRKHQLNACSLCGLCKEVCPTELDMGLVCTELRKLVVADGRMPAAFHDFWLRDMEFSAGDDFFLVRSQPGVSKSKYWFFPGCQLGASDPSYVMNTYRYLTERVKDGVGLYLGCCGAPADWSGRTDILEKNIRTFRENWEGHGKPEVILACPTCHKMFTKYLDDVPVKSLWDIINEQGLPDGYRKGNGVEMALYDPCSSRYVPDVQKSVRNLLANMGYAIEELKMNGRYAQCCSYGGLISTVNPKLAQEIRDERVSASAKDYVTYCPNCRDDFAGNGKPTWHLLDMIFGEGSADGAIKTPPTRSGRLENRRQLKATMMETFWGEKMESQRQEHEKIKLILGDDVEKKMDDRYILLNEIKQVIHHAETNGVKFIDKGAGHSLAHLKIGHVTYWVEYEQSGDSYKVYKTYSHRIQIVEETDDNETK
ncbi:MAG: pyridine nucleotide-disulfide oxidoreductase/dicluster-binding protein [Dehalococcoidia bacterium]